MSYPNGVLGRLWTLLINPEDLFSATWEDLRTFSRVGWAVLELIVCKSAWRLFGASSDPPGSSRSLLDASWEPRRGFLWVGLLGSLGSHWAFSESSWPNRPLRRPQWRPLWAESWGILGAQLRGLMGWSSGHLGPSWGPLGSLLGDLKAILGTTWAVLDAVK